MWLLNVHNLSNCTPGSSLISTRTHIKSKEGYMYITSSNFLKH